MSKSGVLGTLLPVLGGVAALGTGLGAAGIGPLAGLFSAGDAAGAAGAGAADAALTAGTGVADAGAAALPATAGFDAGALGLGTDVGTSALTQAGLPGLASFGAVGSAGLPGAGLDAALPAVGEIGAQGLQGAEGVPGAIGDTGLPAATSLGGVALPTADVAGNALAQAGLPGLAGMLGGDPTAAVSAPLNAVSDATMSAGQVGLGTPFDTGLASAGDAGGGGTDFSGGGGGSDSGGTPWWQNPNNLLKLAPLGLFGLERLMNPSGLPPGGQPVQQAAQTAATNEGILTGQGQQNMSYINTGAVPAGAQAAIDQAANAAKAQVRSAFAGMGVPPGSSMEAQQLAAVDQNTAAQKFDIQNKLLQSGISQFNAAGGFGNQVNQVDLALMQAQIQQEQELEQALAGFAGAAAASGGLFSGGGGTA